MEFSTTLILAGLILALLWIFNVKNKTNRRLPPGPTALPLIGNLLQIDKKAPFKSFVKFSETYGPVMTVYLGWQRTVVLVGYDAVKEALVDQADDFTGRAPTPFLHNPNKKYGIGSSNGERWRQLRRFTLTTLRDFGMGRKGMEEWIQEESEHMRAHMLKLKGSPFDPTFLLSCTVSNVICCLVFSQRFSYEDKQFLRLLTILSHIGKLNSSPVGQEKEISTTEFHYDNLVSTIMTLFLAGTQTTSSTLRFALSVLIKYPKIQETMQQEIDSVTGKGRCPSMEDRKSLPFSLAVIHEMQRFLDLVPLSLPHYTLNDISFRGYTIPKDTVIIPLLHSVLKEEKQWATPRSFNPQHFLDNNGSFKKNPAFMPFSAGKRNCVGESLARMELFIFIVSLLQDFTFSCAGGPDSINLIPEYSSFLNVPCRYHIMATPR